MTKFRSAGHRVSGALMVLALVAPVANGQARGALAGSPEVLVGLEDAKDRSFLGVGVKEIDSGRAAELKLREERGVEVTWVEEGSPASQAGLKKADVVLEYNGAPVQGVEQFVRLVRETPPGRRVKLAVVRGGAQQTLTATIGARESKVLKFGGGSVRIAPHIEIPHIRIPEIPRVFTAWRCPVIGIEAESLEPQLAEYFGVKQGVLVRSVLKGSLAQKAGLRAGDVIQKVNDTSVATPREITGIIEGSRSEKPIPFTIMREKRETTIAIRVEEDRSEGRAPGRMRVIGRGERL